jgi:hypothetical protein
MRTIFNSLAKKNVQRRKVNRVLLWWLQKLGKQHRPPKDVLLARSFALWGYVCCFRFTYIKLASCIPAATGTAKSLDLMRLGCARSVWKGVLTCFIFFLTSLSPRRGLHGLRPEQIDLVPFFVMCTKESHQRAKQHQT